MGKGAGPGGGDRPGSGRGLLLRGRSPRRAGIRVGQTTRRAARVRLPSPIAFCMWTGLPSRCSCGTDCGTKRRIDSLQAVDLGKQSAFESRWGVQISLPFGVATTLPFGVATTLPFGVATTLLRLEQQHHGPVVQFGVHAGLSSRRSRVQIPSGPHNRTRSGSSVGRASA